MDAPPPLITTSNRPDNIAGDLRSLSKINFPDEKLTTRLLTHASQLQEVCDLRIEAWQHSGKTEFVNKQLFPKGWYDELDSTALHWITVNDEQKIVAAARLNLFCSLEAFPYYNAIRHLSIPATVPFAFFSRLVVHPHYRSNGLSRQLYAERAAFCKKKGIAWSQVFINNPGVIRLFETEGFVNIGHAEVNYHIASQPHPVKVFIKENIFK